MTAGWVRAEVDIAGADTAEELHQNASSGSLIFNLMVFNNDPDNAATIKASINSASGSAHGTHKLCADDKVISPLGHYEITARVADVSDYVVVESDDTDVSFQLSGRQDQ